MSVEKMGNRLELLRDSEYFATELVRRLEALVDIESEGHVYESWTRSAAITRKVRGVVRHELDKRRRRAKIAA